MILAFGLTFPLLFILSHFLIKNSVSKKTIYCYLAANLFVIGTSFFNFFNLNKVSDRVYFLEFVSIFMFAVGFLLYTYLSEKRPVEKPVITDGRFIESKWFIALQIAVILIQFYYLARYYYLLNDLGMEKSRLIVYMPGELYKTPLEYYFHILIMDPFVTFCIIKGVYDFTQFKIKNISFVLTVLMILYQLEIGFGRSLIFEILLFVFTAYFVARHFRTDLKKIAPVFGALLLLAVICSFLFTAMRMKISLKAGVSQLFKQFIVYFDGPLRALDKGPSTFFPVFQYSLGRFTFAGLEQIFYLPAKAVGIHFTPLNYVISDYTQKAINIGAVKYFNAYYTSIMNFYVDFGLAGVAAVPFIFGAFLGKTAKMLHDEQDLTAGVIFAYSFYCMILSLLQWPFQAPGTWAILIALFVIRGIRRALRKRAEKAEADKTLEFDPVKTKH